LNLKSINLTNGDTVVKTTVRTINKKLKTKIGYTYYWFSSGYINHNVGSCTGKLLHGRYEVFDKELKLIVQGTFNLGLKTGIWMNWYPNGNIKFIGNYKKGLLCGAVKLYSENGQINSLLRYKNGLLDGRSYFFRDSLVICKYKEGKEIVKSSKIHSHLANNKNVKTNKHPSKKVFFLNWKKKPIVNNQSEGKGKEANKISNKDKTKVDKKCENQKTKSNNSNVLEGKKKVKWWEKIKLGKHDSSSEPKKSSPKNLNNKSILTKDNVPSEKK
jgi:antitoxin component YwqK of YwqJK toxin-antitoxin module